MFIVRLSMIVLLTSIGVFLTLVCVLLGIIICQEIIDQYRVLKERANEQVRNIHKV